MANSWAEAKIIPRQTLSKVAGRNTKERSPKRSQIINHVAPENESVATLEHD